MAERRKAPMPPPPSLFERLVTKVTGPRDIELPNESGKRDPRLPMTPAEALKKAAKGFKELKRRKIVK